MSLVEMIVARLPHLTPAVLHVLGGIWIFLIVSTILGKLLELRFPGPGMDAVNTRIYGWWWMTGIYTVAMGLGPKIFVLFIAFISFVALKEFFTLVPTRRADHRALFWSYGSLLIQYPAIALGWFHVFLLYLPLYHLLVGPFRIVLRGETEHFVRSSAVVHWGLMICVFCVSHVAYLGTLGLDGNPKGGGAGLALFLVMLTELSDVAQFIFGKTLGKHKIMPKVSPNKTWEGLLGGVLTLTVLGSLLGPVITPLNHLTGALCGFALAWVGYVGGAVMSAVKRDVGVKDAGELIPGHGGILDRIDSLAYTAPVGFYIFYFGYYT